MLLEDFLNRYKNPNIADFKFPHVIFPLLLIFGVILCLPVAIIVFICYIGSIKPDLFTPHLMLVCGLAGGGLALGVLFFGALWGLLKEKKAGFKRRNFDQLFVFYLTVMSASLPLPAFWFYGFFYNYPFVRYPSYIMEVKPTPELEREIERLGLAEIKWHTPFDYSKERQTVRYDFANPLDNPTIAEQKDTLFYNTANKTYKRPDSPQIRNFLESVDLDNYYYPVLLKQPSGDICALKVYLNKKIDFSDRYYLSEGIELISVKTEHNVIYFDASSIFYPNNSIYWSEPCVKRITVESFELFSFWAANLMLPNIYQNIFNYKVEIRTDVDFSLENLIQSLKSL